MDDYNKNSLGAHYRQNKERLLEHSENTTFEIKRSMEQNDEQFIEDFVKYDTEIRVSSKSK
jgi:hypothetical protein